MSGIPEIPKRMRTLERDPRGYPIPYIVMRDANGRPHFTINAYDRVKAAIRRKTCGICGYRLRESYWFVGGKKCFTEPNGAFLDPAMHRECAEFALQTCPYLALPSYNKRIDDRTLSPDAMPQGASIIGHVEVPDERPDVFGLGNTKSYRVVDDMPGALVIVPGPWRYVEFWRHGAPVMRTEP